MDFGINNQFTFNYVESQLKTGGLYEGWHIASFSQVNNLFTHMVMMTNYDKYSPNEYANGYGIAYEWHDLTSSGRQETSFSKVFNITSMNYFSPLKDTEQGNRSMADISLGLFYGADFTIDYIKLLDRDKGDRWGSYVDYM